MYIVNLLNTMKVTTWIMWKEVLVCSSSIPMEGEASAIDGALFGLESDEPDEKYVSKIKSSYNSSDYDINSSCEEEGDEVEQLVESNRIRRAFEGGCDLREDN